MQPGEQHTTMALVMRAAGLVALHEVTLTPPGPSDLIVRTAYTSISAGTERMLLAGQMPHPLLAFPLVPGYETVGRVVACGADAPADLEGRWVYVGGARCYEGLNAAWGGQAAELVVDHQRVVPLDGVAPELGVLLALAATALHGADLLDRPARALVLGQGPVGQIVARLLRARGARVTVVDRVASRLERSVADHVVDVAARGLVEQVEGVFDTIVEASGSMAALEGALPLLADGATLLLLGYYHELRLPYMPLFLKQARLLTAREWAAGDLQRCRDLLAAGALDLAPLITHRLPIDAYSEAYRIALDDPACLKLVLVWQ